jgi:hypothetical protein
VIAPLGNTNLIRAAPREAGRAHDVAEVRDRAATSVAARAVAGCIATGCPAHMALILPAGMPGRRAS